MMFKVPAAFRTPVLLLVALALVTMTLGVAVAHPSEPRELSGRVAADADCLPCALQKVTGKRIPKPGGDDDDDDDQVFDYGTGDCLDGGSGC